MFIYLILIIFTLLYTFHYKKTKLLNASKNLIFPPMHPIIGNALIFFNKSPPELLAAIGMLKEKYGNTVTTLVGMTMTTLIFDPKDVETILTSQTLLTKGESYNFIRKWLGDGLVVSTGAKWSVRRKAITPAFHFTILNRFVKIFDEHGDNFIRRLEKVKPNELVDIFPMIGSYGLDVICATAMSTTIDPESEAGSTYINAVKGMTQVVNLRAFNPLLKNNFLYKLSSTYRMEKKHLKILHGFTDSVIARRRMDLLNEKHLAVESNPDDVGVPEKKSLIDILLQANINGEALTDAEIREEVDTFMFAGHDTTSSGTTFALYAIAKHQDIQEKLVQEIVDVLGDDVEKPVTILDMNNLGYLDMVIKEALRLYPPSPMIARKITKDTQLNDKILPSGSYVRIGIFYIHRDANIFPDPKKFDPERFNSERTKKTLHPYAYIPFSAGPRNCIGQKYAQYEMKSIIIKILRRFVISTPATGEPIVVADVILRPWEPVKLNFKPRLFT